jgi:hypothetical protein
MDDSYQMQLAVQQSLVTECESRVRALELELSRAAERHRLEQERLRELKRQLQLSVNENERLQDENQRLLAIGRPEPLPVAELEAERDTIVRELQVPGIPEARFELLSHRFAEIQDLLSYVTISPPSSDISDLTRRLDRLSAYPPSRGGRVVRTQFAVIKV